MVCIIPWTIRRLHLIIIKRTINACRHIRILVAMILFFVAADAVAAPDKDFIPGPEEQHSARERIYHGYSTVVVDGDTMTIFYLRNLTVYPPMKFRNKKERENYDRLVRNIRITLPYAKMIRETLIETYEYVETFPDEKQRQAYLKQMEKDLFKQYKPILKRFSKRQAKLLIKLIQRETNQSSYEIVKAFLGSFRAAFWQGFGKLFGVSLRGKYQPDKNKEDALIERIATQVEQGTL